MRELQRIVVGTELDLGVVVIGADHGEDSAEARVVEERDELGGEEDEHDVQAHAAHRGRTDR